MAGRRSSHKKRPGFLDYFCAFSLLVIIKLLDSHGNLQASPETSGTSNDIGHQEAIPLKTPASTGASRTISDTGRYGRPDLRVFAVATESTPGFQRFNRSLDVNGLRGEILGFGSEWKGGNVARGPGGGQKILLFRDALKRFKDDDNMIVLFTDSYDVIITAGADDIVTSFESFKADVVFSAEPFCWPDPSLSSLYPKPEAGGKRFLNSGAFIGRAPVIYQTVSSSPVQEDDDDQLFYTKIFLNDFLKKKWLMKLDSRSRLFQNLNGVFGEIELRFGPDDTTVHNTLYHTHPVIIHGNGPSKLHLNSLGNYLSKSWTLSQGCNTCQQIPETSASGVNLLLGIFIERPTPFLTEFFEDISRLDFPKENITLFVHSSVQFHEEEVRNFTSQAEKYKAVKVVDKSITHEWQARNMAMEECILMECDFYMSLDSEARVTNPNTVTNLMRLNREIVAPLLLRPNKLWSNFWGALSSEGYYARSFDYLDIVSNVRRGVWNVPHVSQAFMMKGDVIRRGFYSQENNNEVEESATKKGNGHPYPSFIDPLHPRLDAEMAFSKSLRDAGVFIFVSNLEEYGHLVNPESFTTSHKHNDLYEIYTNQKDWERRYIHPNYSRIFATDETQGIDQPCQDVYWFPVVTETFCQHLIEEMENFGQWSSGTNNDERLTGGYENVPTRDIHMNQVGLEQPWLFFLREYIRPVQEKLFIGYFHDPPKAIMNFVVRYKPDEQPSLRPHHDSSTYTINIALNRPGIDYEGGGCRFLRYNCSVINLKRGWSLMHPGRLTHYHEGLPVTSGTRYIMISFVDP